MATHTHTDTHRERERERERETDRQMAASSNVLSLWHLATSCIGHVAVAT